MAKTWMNIKAWVRENKKEFLILLVILLVGAFLRLYRIDEYMIFLGDEGRDVIAVRRLLVYGDLIFVGPGTSLGNMYLGPLYYYMMAPSLLLANFSPVGPAVMVALLGVATILLVWYVSKEWFGKTPALFVSFLYAISPTVVIFSKSSWNPNIMPFFSLAAIYAIWKAWSARQAKWLIVLGISYAFVLQSHYFGILLAPVLFIFWILGLKRAKKSQSVGNFIRYTIYGALIFSVLMFPLVLFDFKHNWRNFGAMKDFIFENQGSFSGGVRDILKRLLPVFRQLITRLIAGRNEFIGLWTAFILGLSTMILFVKKRRRELILILVWLMVGIFGLASFNQQIFDHYFGFLFPAPFLLLGAISQHIATDGTRRIKILFLSIYLLLVGVNLIGTPLRYPPNRQFQKSREIAGKIQEVAGNQRFNLATISKLNNRDVYQYFLEVWGEPVVDTDPARPEYTITDQLFVVCEKPREECKPTTDPAAWITNFGWSKIENSWDVAGVTVYKLVHSEDWLKQQGRK